MGADGAWETVELFIDPVSAQVARSRLEAEGIECYLADEGMGGMLTYGLLRGVRLQVRPADLERARALLAEEADADASAEDDTDPES